MALSEYDKAQFESLTADFAIEDATALKIMEKRDKASEMSFVPLPHLHMVPLAAAFVSLLFVIAGRVAGNHSQMLAAGGISLLCVMVSMLLTPQEPPRDVEEDTEKDEK